MEEKLTFAQRLKARWLRVPEAYRVEIISVAQTFITVFGGTFVLFIQSNVQTEWTAETITSLIVAAIVAAARAGVKAVWIAIAAWISARAKAKKE